MYCKRILAALLLMLTLSACTTVETRTEGLRFDADAVKRLKVGVTTRDEVTELFGTPGDTVPLTGGERLVYTFTEKRTPTYLGGIIRNEYAGKKVKRRLEVVIRDGVVSSYSFRDVEE